MSLYRIDELNIRRKVNGQFMASNCFLETSNKMTKRIENINIDVTAGSNMSSDKKKLKNIAELYPDEMPRLADDQL